MYNYHRSSALRNGSAGSNPSVGQRNCTAIPARQADAVAMANDQIPVGFGVWRGPAQHYVFPDTCQQQPSVIDVQAPRADLTVDPADRVLSEEPIIVMVPAHHQP